MLRNDVVEAARNGAFRIYAVETIDEGMEILTGVPAGERDQSERFPEGSVNHRVETRLIQLAEQRLTLAQAVKRDGDL